MFENPLFFSISSRFSRAKILILGLFLLLTAFNARAYSQGFSQEKTQRISDLIMDNHFQASEVVLEDIQNSASLNRYLNQLDPYSKYFNPKEASFKKQRSKLQRLGIGLDYLIHNDLLLGVPIENGPVYMTGMTEPAYICSINQQKIKESKFKTYRFLTQLSLGQEVEVQTMSQKGKKLNKYKVRVKPFFQKHVSIEHFAQYDVLRIRQFSDNVTKEIKKVSKQLANNKYLIIDLRHNPGGDLYSTIDTLSFFLNENLNVAYLKEKNLRKPISLKTVSGRLFSNQKIYLLLSQYTASSAEIFAQALKHYLPQTVLIGADTAGKCIAQELHLLSDKSILQLSAYEVLNADKKSCQNIPLLVDIKIKNIEIMPLEQVIGTLIN